MPPQTLKCPTCVAGGQTSEVNITNKVSEIASFREYYDANGVYHCHYTGNFQASYSCDKGHTWTAPDSVPCPAGDQ